MLLKNLLELLCTFQYKNSVFITNLNEFSLRKLGIDL